MYHTVQPLLENGGQSKGCGPSPNVSVPESSRDSGDDYREKPEGRGARQT